MHKMIRKVGSLTQKKQKKKMRNRKFKQPFLEFINKTKEAILNCGISIFLCLLHLKCLSLVY